MRRNEIVNELNKKTLHYNLRWDDIKYDADKAIYDINSTLGSAYPPLSTVLHNDDVDYVDRVGEEDIPIIKNEYFLTVIIPFIAMEVLARDEEFTTVYSKYQQEHFDGKHRMLVNEFNNVPDKYRRDGSQGVIFPSDNKGKRW